MAKTPRTTPELFFVDMSPGRRVWESVGGPIVTGLICGFLITFALWAYVLGVLVSFGGGVPVGAQQRTLPGALLRTFIGGTVWALMVVLVVGVTGWRSILPLGDPSIAFLPWGFVPACVVGAISWGIAARRRRSRASVSASASVGPVANR
jgi:hypothetical protein